MRTALVLWVGLVLALTLAPGQMPMGPRDPFDISCLICGPRGAADLILNTALFVPLGFMAGARWGWRRAVLLGVGLTVFVELGQMAVPGRLSTLGDVVANATGAALGAGLVGRVLRALPVLAVLALVGAASPFTLLAPDPPEGSYHGQWTARFEDMAHYSGRVLSARVGDRDVPSRRSARSAELRRVLAHDGPVEVSFLTGPPTPRLAPVFSIFDERRREIFLLGVDGTDLVVRRWLRARSLRMDAPELRWGGALDRIPTGAPVRARLERGLESPCLALDDQVRCDLAPAQGAGWAHLLSPGGRPVLSRELLGVLFMVGLGVSMGFGVPNAVVGAGLVGSTAIVGLALSEWLPYMTSSIPQALALALGGLASSALRVRTLSRSAMQPVHGCVERVRHKE